MEQIPEWIVRQAVHASQTFSEKVAVEKMKRMWPDGKNPEWSVRQAAHIVQSFGEKVVGKKMKRMWPDMAWHDWAISQRSTSLGDLQLSTYGRHTVEHIEKRWKRSRAKREWSVHQAAHTVQSFGEKVVGKKERRMWLDLAWHAWAISQRSTSLGD